MMLYDIMICNVPFYNILLYHILFYNILLSAPPPYFSLPPSFILFPLFISLASSHIHIDTALQCPQRRSPTTSSVMMYIDAKFKSEVKVITVAHYFPSLTCSCNLRSTDKPSAEISIAFKKRE